MAGWLSWSYWYVLPFAVVVAMLANASGFSGGVLFQPFFYLVLDLPIHQSIATGVATETIGMSSGAFRYVRMGKVDLAAVRRLFPAVTVGVVLGLVFFVHAPRDLLRLTVGLVVGAIAVLQLCLAGARRYGTADRADGAVLRRHAWVAALAGTSSAGTGTGVAELHQPLLEQRGGLATKRANATAIFLEAGADWIITAVNLSLHNLRLDILIFSATGVFIGAQLGALLSPRLPDRLLRSIFAVCVLGIGTFYVTTSVANLL